MIRVLLGCALPALGFGMAAAFVGPALVATPNVEPIVVAGASSAAEFQPASFHHSGCASTLLLGDLGETARAGLRLVALVYTPGSSDTRLLMRDLEPGSSTEGAVAVLVVDADGRILAALDRERLAGGCDETAAGKPVGAI